MNHVIPYALPNLGCSYLALGMLLSCVPIWLVFSWGVRYKNVVVSHQKLLSNRESFDL